jgi:hypothetical protein
VSARHPHLCDVDLTGKMNELVAQSCGFIEQLSVEVRERFDFTQSPPWRILLPNQIEITS